MKRVSLVLLVILMMWAGNAFAAYVGWEFSDDDLVMDIGDSLTLDLYARDVAASDALVGYGFVLNWNSAVLQWVSPADAASVPIYPWIDFGLSGSTPSSLSVQAGSWPPGSSQSGDFLLGSLTFNCLSGGSSPLTLTDWLAVGPNWLTYDGRNIGPDLFGETGVLDLGTVTVGTVPIPAAIWILGSGLLGLLGLRRKFTA